MREQDSPLLARLPPQGHADMGGDTSISAQPDPSVLKPVVRIPQCGADRTHTWAHQLAYQLPQPIRTERFGIIVQENEMIAACGADTEVALSRPVEWAAVADLDDAALPGERLQVFRRIRVSGLMIHDHDLEVGIVGGIEDALDAALDEIEPVLGRDDDGHPRGGFGSASPVADRRFDAGARPARESPDPAAPAARPSPEAPCSWRPSCRVLRLDALG